MDGNNNICLTRQSEGSCPKEEVRKLESCGNLYGFPSVTYVFEESGIYGKLCAACQEGIRLAVEGVVRGSIWMDDGWRIKDDVVARGRRGAFLKFIIYNV